MRTRLRPPLSALAFLLVAGPAAAQEDSAVIDAVFPDGRMTAQIDSLIATIELADGEDFRVVELGRTDHSSHHLVFIRDREIPHRHDRHDLLLVVLRGHGGMLQGDAERPFGEESIVFIPRGGVHALRNAASEPAVAYAVFTPAFDGQDRVDASK
ncbi:MAG TPA: cupin domain-containing protein [Longimicrobiales bacterium]|nr:cupin domain-containing protein [Longimicrobiales bacterium]